MGLLAIAVALLLPSQALAQTTDDEWSASFRILLQGRPVGTEVITVTRDADGTTLRSDGGLSAGGFTLQSAEIVYAPDGSPRRLRMEALAKGQPMLVDTKIAGTQATTAVTMGETSNDLSHVIATNAILMPNNLYSAAQGLALRLVTLDAGATVPLFVVPQAQIQATLTAVNDERLQTASGMHEVRRHTLDVDNANAPLAMTIWAEKQTGRLVRFSIAAAQLDVVREDLTSVFTREVREHRENDQTLMIPAVGFSLGATVSRPAGKTAPDPKAKTTERLPAVVFVVGSGPVDRDSTVYGIPVIAQLAGLVADAGYITVRYDKRGIGQSGGRAESATLADYAEDLVSVVKWLRKQKDVDPNRITVVGHSEGAAVALLAASRTGDIKAVASVSGVGTTGAELILEQQRMALATLKLSDEEKAKRVALQKQIMSAVLSPTGEGWDGVPEAMRKQADTPWFRSFLAYDPATVMPKVKQPLLVLHGERDRQVPLANAELLNGLGLKRKNGTTTMQIVPGVNHLLVPAQTGEVNEYGKLGNVRVSPDVARAITDWIAGLPARR